MQAKKFRFSSGEVQYYFEGSFSRLSTLMDRRTTVLITDEHVFEAHKNKFRNWNTIVLKPGEEFKVQATVDAIIEQLIDMQADRSFTLVGVGGGVITDLTGYVGSIFLRGLRTGFIPTSLLAMVDASIGGKNGIDIGVYKNMAGTIRQPHFILFDVSLLSSLPEAEWQNGFAEIIKHGAIRDAAMFRGLEAAGLDLYRRKKKELQLLVQRNAFLKTKLVQLDEFEVGERKMLNFGHTIGHALENQYELSHGQAISIGMTYAASISRQVLGFKDEERLTDLLRHYGLPTYAEFDLEKVLEVLQMDKKRKGKEIHFILLQRIGKAAIQPLPLKEIGGMLS